jgi:thiosulfate/3-mercaptopyruvate sulfurtransferase
VAAALVRASRGESARWRLPCLAGRRLAGRGGRNGTRAAQIEARLASGSLLLLDARDPQRFAGAAEPIDAKAGHIPGAINWPFNRNLDAEGRFRPAAELAADLRKLVGATRAADVAVMCGSGVTACHTLFAMELAGLFPAPNDKPALYCGSWSEWIRSDTRPVAIGNDPHAGQEIS